MEEYIDLEKERRRQMLLKKKSHLISIRAASPISSPYYSNLSDGAQRREIKHPQAKHF